MNVLQGTSNLEQMLEMVYPLPNLHGHRRSAYDLIFEMNSNEEGTIRDFFRIFFSCAYILKSRTDDRWSTAEEAARLPEDKLGNRKLIEKMTSRAIITLQRATAQKNLTKFMKKDNNKKVFILS